MPPPQKIFECTIASTDLNFVVGRQRLTVKWVASIFAHQPLKLSRWIRCSWSNRYRSAILVAPARFGREYVDKGVLLSGPVRLR